MSRSAARLAHLGPAEWAVLDAAVAEFEHAWHCGDAPGAIARFLPEAGEPLRTTIFVELIRVDQEHRWRHGERRQVEEYLVEWPQLAGHDAVLVELIASECLTRISCGDELTQAELERRFPGMSGRIDLARIAAEAHAEERGGRPEPSGALINDSGPTAITPEGVLFGRYKLRGQLGAGSMGLVCRAYDPLLRRDVALKIPSLTGLLDDDDGGTHGSGDPAHADRLGDLSYVHGSGDPCYAPGWPPEVVELFLREAQAAARVDHRNVAKVLDAGQEGGVPWFAMQLIEGTRLDRWIGSRGVADPVDAARIVAQLADGLAALHAHGLIHGDVKAANVILDHDGTPVLTDFGLARPVSVRGDSSLSRRASPHPEQPEGCAPTDALDSFGVFAGTPAYMSPEQATGRPVDVRSDIYSLGVVFYHLLAGELPFRGGVKAVLDAVENDQPAPPSVLRPALDRRLEAVCLQAMAKSPDDRYQTAHDMRDALAQLLEESRASGRRERHDVMWLRAAALGSAAVCVAVAIAVVLAIRQRRSDDVTFQASSVSVASKPDPLPAVVPPEQETLLENVQTISRRLQRGEFPADPDHPRVAGARADLLGFMYRFQGRPETLLAARVLVQLPWPRPTRAGSGHQFWDRTRLADESERIAPFLRLQPAQVTYIYGRLVPPAGVDRLSLWVARSGTVLMDVYSLDPDCRPLIGQRWTRADGSLGTNSHGGAWDGVGHTAMPFQFAVERRWVDFEITGDYAAAGANPGRYLLALTLLSEDERRTPADRGGDGPLERIRREVDATRSLDTGNLDPRDNEIAGWRKSLLGILRQPGQAPEVQEAAELLIRLPWPDAADRRDDVQWIKVADPSDPPHGGGIHLLPGQGTVIHDRIIEAGQRNSFRLILDRPGPVMTRLVSLTPGFCAHLEQVWRLPDRGAEGDRPTESDASGGLVYQPALSRVERVGEFHTSGIVYHVQSSPHADAAPAEGRTETGEYLLYVWQPE
ncbi:MAG TPA: serine/threonine-protein kinase [Planctomycetaceae bacterium]|nr:serine/threonine-protein kinase [Planctomycetaceae bacterium]